MSTLAARVNGASVVCQIAKWLSLYTQAASKSPQRSIVRVKGCLQCSYIVQCLHFREQGPYQSKLQQVDAVASSRGELAVYLRTYKVSSDSTVISLAG